MKIRRKKELQVLEARAKFKEAAKGTALLAVPVFTHKRPLWIALAFALGFLSSSKHTKTATRSILAGRLLQKLLF